MSDSYCFCEYCRYWCGPGFATLEGGDNRHFLPDNSIKNLKGKCERFPISSDTNSFSTCGEFSVNPVVLHTLSSALRNINTFAQKASIDKKKMKEERDAARRNSTRIYAKLKELKK